MGPLGRSDDRPRRRRGPPVIARTHATALDVRFFGPGKVEAVVEVHGEGLTARAAYAGTLEADRLTCAALIVVVHDRRETEVLSQDVVRGLRDPACVVLGPEGVGWPLGDLHAAAAALATVGGSPFVAEVLDLCMAELLAFTAGYDAQAEARLAPQ